MLNAGTHVGPFEVLSSLGAGGMGEVYRARDPRLERDIALKVLPAQTVADETSRARMVREARMAARLNHPHVCTVHEVGEANGLLYIAMELVEGRSLATLLVGGPLPAEQTLRYGAQIAGALAHAHGRGVVHRDLKSANVVITPDGQAKVLDFGLAKPLASEDLAEATTLTEEPLTRTGVVVGTLAYMAPEQLRGQAADALSDIWALGVVLHEMASGERPFQGGTGYELSSAILGQPPSPLPTTAPAGLASVVERCLAKAPGERFQRASEVQAALETLKSGGVVAGRARRPAFRTSRRVWLAAAALAAVLAVLAILDVGGVRRLLTGGGAPPGVVRMAVLPFANLSGDPEQEYLSDGLTQEMIAQLGRLHPGSLSVIARTSVMRYKKADTPVDQIGRELGVQYVLEGSAQREGSRVRVSAELIQVKDQAQLWADVYEREMAGILALQSDVARNVAESLALKLLPAEQARLAGARDVNPEAYEAYLKGMQHVSYLTPQALEAGLKYFELALKKDPNYAPAYVGAAFVWLDRQQMGYTAPREAGPKAKAAALKAIELDSTLGEGHSALAAFNYLHEWNWAGAEAEFKKAIELNPNDPDARALYSHLLMIMQRPEEAMAQIRRALEMDPLNTLIQMWHGADLEFADRYDDAITQGRELLRASPQHPGAHSMLAGLFFRNGRYEDSLAETKASYAGDREMEQALTEGYAQSGYQGAVRRAAETLAGRAPTTYVSPIDVAMLYLRAGDNAHALEWLEKGFEARDPNMPYLDVYSDFDGLRSEPRFQALLRKMGLPQRRTS